MKNLFLALMPLALAVAAPASADTSFGILGVAPATPHPGDTVHAQVRLHACDRIVSVESVAGVIRLERENWRSVCFAIIDQDVAIGQLPEGSYEAEIGYYDRGTWNAEESETFAVTRSPSASLPGISLSGAWADPTRPGVGLWVLQRERDLGAIFATYENGAPAWYLVSAPVGISLQRGVRTVAHVHRFAGATGAAVADGVIEIKGPGEFELTISGATAIAGEYTFRRF